MAYLILIGTQESLADTQEIGVNPVPDIRRDDNGDDGTVHANSSNLFLGQ